MDTKRIPRTTIQHLTRAIAAGVLLAALSACGRSDPASNIASARTYLGKSNYPAAIIELKSALQTAPNNAEARFLLAKALLEGGDPVSAETEVRKALELKYPPEDANPVLAQALVRQGQFKKVIAEFASALPQSGKGRAEVGAALGNAYLALGQNKDARTAIEAALAAQPDNVNALLAQAKMKALERDLPGALQVIEAVLAIAPADVEALMTKARFQGAQGKRDEAIATLEHLISTRPDALAARSLVVSSLVQAGQLDKASTQLDAMRKYAPGDPRTLYGDALVAFARGNVPAAKEAIDKVVQAAPDYLPARYLSGLVDLRRGSYATAEDSLRLVVAKSPSDEGARRALAEVYLRRGQAAKALETLEPSLQRTPDDPSLLRIAAELHLARNDPAASAELFAKANALDKQNVSGRVRLAQIRLATGDTGQALKDLEELAATNPASREPDVALVSAHLRGRDYEKALAVALSFEAKQPTSPVAQNIKGVVFMAKGDTKSARASFEKAVALDPTFVVAVQNLARLDMNERNFESARKRYEELLAKDPKSETALLALAEILVVTKAPAADVKAAIDRAIAANPTSVKARIALIAHYGRLKDWNGALAAAQAAQLALPDTPQILEALGATQFAAGETNQAAESFRRLARLQPESIAPLRRLAEIQVKAKDYDGAIGTLRSALALAPSAPELWVTLAGVYAAAGRVDAGLAEARNLQKQFPKRAEGFAIEGELFARQSKWPETVVAYRAALAREPLPFCAGRLHSALVAAGKPDEAAKLVQKWLTDHPKDMAMRNYVAQLSMAKKDYQAAIPQLRAALKIEPDNIIVLNNLAWSLAELGDPTALQHAERAYAIAPNSSAVTDTFGWILYQRGDTARSVDLLRKASSLAPEDSTIRLHFARALLKAGDKPGAKKELEQAAKAESAEVRAEAEQLLKEL